MELSVISTHESLGRHMCIHMMRDREHNRISRSPLSTIPLTTDISPKFPLPSAPLSPPNFSVTLPSPSLNYQFCLLGGRGHSGNAGPPRLVSRRHLLWGK